MHASLKKKLSMNFQNFHFGQNINKNLDLKIDICIQRKMEHV